MKEVKNVDNCCERECPQLAIIVPCYNEELCVKTTADQLIFVLKDLISKGKIKDTS